MAVVNRVFSQIWLAYNDKCSG